MGKLIDLMAHRMWHGGGELERLWVGGREWVRPVILTVTGGVVSSFTRGGTNYTQVMFRQSGKLVGTGSVAESQWAIGAGGASTMAGFNKGGGGGGEVYSSPIGAFEAGAYDIGIGAGGAPQSPGSGSTIIKDGALEFARVAGGGLGGSGATTGGAGGNGGGAGGNPGVRSGGGGAKFSGGSSGGLDRSPGGGGGAGGVGGAGGPSIGIGGNGGAGITLLWTNPPLDVGGGGGGGGNVGATGSASHGGSAGTDNTTPANGQWGGGAGGSRVNVGVSIANGGDGFFVLVFPSSNATVVTA